MMQRMCFLVVLFALVACAKNACADGLFLNWNPSPSSNVIGYDVYYGATSGIYSYKVSVTGTSVTLSNMVPGQTYYIAATAYDAAGNESPFSSEISYTVPMPSGLAMVPGASAGAGGVMTMEFPAQAGHWYEVQATTDFQNWTSVWQSTVAASNLVMQFTDPNAASFASRFYRLVTH
jgi:hypothetical protein